MSFIIVFWDKAKLQISDEAAENLMAAIQAETIKTFTLDRSLYSVSGVNKIIPKEEARRSYPDDWGYFNEMVDALPGQDFIQLVAKKSEQLTEPNGTPRLSDPSLK